MINFDILLDRFLWWRKLRGGHWEHWLLPQGGGPIWFRIKECSKGGWPPGLGCRGTPRCETHGVALDII